MNFQQESIDYMSQIKMPTWIMSNIDNLQDPSIYLNTDSSMILGNNSESIISDQQNNYISYPNNINNKSHNHKHPVSYELNYQQKSSSDIEQDSDDNTTKKQLINKKPRINKQQRRNETSRKYRQRRKQYLKNVQQENNFLKFKVDQLTFKLRQLQTQLSKLKNNVVIQQNIPNYHSVKQQYLNELQRMIENKITDQNQYQKVQKKLLSVVAFDGKQKIDLLNFFMSQLMENVITDKAFYFIDGLIKKTGVHTVQQNKQMRKIDYQVFEILNLDDNDRKTKLKQIQWSKVQKQARRFQQLWKMLYQVYLAILNQGFKMQRLMQTIKDQLKTMLKVSDMLRLQLHFEKNKLRYDIREMRSLWFRQLQRENALNNALKCMNSKQCQRKKQLIMNY